MEIKKLRIAAVAVVASCLALGGATASLALGEDAKIASAAIDTSDTKTYGNVRIWMRSDANYDTSIGKAEAKIKLWFHYGNYINNGGGGDAYLSDFINSNFFANRGENYRPYYFADVPYEEIAGTYLTIQRFDPTGQSFWSNIGCLQMTDDNITSIIEVDSTGYDSWTTVGGDNVGYCDAKMAATALAGIKTCSASPVNGFMSFKKIVDTFIFSVPGSGKDYEPGKDMGNCWELTTEDSQLDNYWIDDYEYGDDWKAEDESAKTKSINAYNDKFLSLQKLYDSSFANI